MHALLRSLLLVAIALPLTGILARSVYQSLATGKAVLAGRGLRPNVIYTRRRTPIRFWLTVVGRLAMTVALVAIVLAQVTR